MRIQFISNWNQVIKMAESGEQLSYIKDTARPWLRIFTFQRGSHLPVGSILI